MLKIFSALGANLLFIRDIGRLTIQSKVSRSSVFIQTWRVYVQSFPTTAMAGFFVGGILCLQFSLQVKSFGALGYLGGLATSSTIREVGPLLIAFMLCGKIGAFTSAELGTMRVTEQLDAIRCLGANPLVEIVVPRFWGIVFASFFLLILGLFTSLFGGMLMGKYFAGVNFQEYLRHIPSLVSMASLYGSAFKCLSFSVLLAGICTYQGYFAKGGSKGVGRAVVSTSVQTMVGLVLMDWLTSAFTEALLLVYREM